MPRTPSATEAVEAAIATLDGTLAIARALVDSGRRIELDGLENDAAALCTALLLLAPEAARDLRPALIGLRCQLDELVTSLAA